MARSLTFIAHLKNAPFPYDGGFADQRRAFFDTTHRGQRAHTTGDGKVYPEHPHYTDDRVLFHVPREFDAALPSTIVVFFHGHHSELRRSVLDDLQIARQIDLSRRNVVLIAPQLARNAADSAAGKLFRRNGLKHLLDEAIELLVGRTGARRLRTAPVILAAYSGGYRSLAFCLDRGGIARRLRGIVLLDALYGEEDKLATWIARQRGFTYVLGGPSTASGHKHLLHRLNDRGVAFQQRWDGTLDNRAVVFEMTPTSHRRLPLSGPPRWPLAAVLRAAIHGDREIPEKFPKTSIG